jgi:hypothetical protein
MAATRTGTAAWKRTRAEVLRRDPMCQIRRPGTTTLSRISRGYGAMQRHVLDTLKLNTADPLADFDVPPYYQSFTGIKDLVVPALDARYPEGWFNPRREESPWHKFPEAESVKRAIRKLAAGASSRSKCSVKSGIGTANRTRPEESQRTTSDPLPGGVTPVGNSPRENMGERRPMYGWRCRLGRSGNGDSFGNGNLYVS